MTYFMVFLKFLTKDKSENFQKFNNMIITIGKMSFKYIFMSKKDELYKTPK